MITWTKEQVQNLRKACYAHRDDAFVEEKLMELNIHLNHYEKAFQAQVKSREWKEVERLASEMSGLVPAV
ncbi:MAG TPA: hypothetical protein VG733_05990 [Chthoniobacteraceae bacterium]|nr:hypothetical protein [Chthoniobacteraceae bacterium]